MSGHSGTPIVQKLGIKPGFCIFTGALRLPRPRFVGELPPGVTIADRPQAPLDMAHIFTMRSAGLATTLRSCRPAIEPDGMIWLSWPKKSSGIATDLTDVVVRQTALALGLVDIKVCAIDEIGSGLKFVIPVRSREGRAARRGFK
jgi:hypothetical protein